MVELMREFDVEVVGMGVMVKRLSASAKDKESFGEIRALVQVEDEMDRESGAKVVPAPWLSE